MSQCSNCEHEECRKIKRAFKRWGQYRQWRTNFCAITNGITIAIVMMHYMAGWPWDALHAHVLMQMSVIVVIGVLRERSAQTIMGELVDNRREAMAIAQGALEASREGRMKVASIEDFLLKPKPEPKVVN